MHTATKPHSFYDAVFSLLWAYYYNSNTFICCLSSLCLYLMLMMMVMILLSTAGVMFSVGSPLSVHTSLREEESGWRTCVVGLERMIEKMQFYNHYIRFFFFSYKVFYKAMAGCMISNLHRDHLEILPVMSGSTGNQAHSYF